MPGRDIDHRAVEQGRTGRQGRTFADWYEQESQAVRSAYEQGDLFGGYRRLNQMNQKLMENETMLQAMATNPAVSHNDEARRYADAARRALEGHHDTSIPAHLKDPVDNPNVIQFESRKLGMNLPARRYFETTRKRTGEDAYAEGVMHYATGMMRQRVSGGQDDKEKEQLQELGFQASGANDFIEFAHKQRLAVTSWVAGFDPTQQDTELGRIKIDSVEDDEKKARYVAGRARAERSMTSALYSLHQVFGLQAEEVSHQLMNYLGPLDKDDPGARARRFEETAGQLIQSVYPLVQSGTFAKDDLGTVVQSMIKQLGVIPEFLSSTRSAKQLASVTENYVDMFSQFETPEDQRTLDIQMELAVNQSMPEALRGALSEGARDYFLAMGATRSIIDDEDGLFEMSGGKGIAQSLGKRLRDAAVSRETGRLLGDATPQEWMQKIIQGGDDLTPEEQTLREEALAAPLLELVGEVGFTEGEARTLLDVSFNKHNLEEFHQHHENQERFRKIERFARSIIGGKRPGFLSESPVVHRQVLETLHPMMTEEQKSRYNVVYPALPARDHRKTSSRTEGVRESSYHLIKEVVSMLDEQGRSMDQAATVTQMSKEQLVDLTKRLTTHQRRRQSEASYHRIVQLVQSQIENKRLSGQDAIKYGTILNFMGASLQAGNYMTYLSFLDMFAKTMGSMTGAEKFSTAQTISKEAGKAGVTIPIDEALRLAKPMSPLYEGDEDLSTASSSGTRKGKVPPRAPRAL